MPYAQQHFPFENQKEFEEMFPADFIAEGIDQTRGWFYTLVVISTALFGKAPFKNLIANGMVLAGDGQKMSKRKKNYPDPMEVVHKFGSDALRLYLISSPVVRAENLRFKEEGVRDIIKDVFLPWYNAFRFLFQNLEMYVKENDFVYDETQIVSTNVMDRWILSFTQSLLEYVRKEMGLYHLYNVVPRLTKFVDYLTNWYVRMNRKRLKGDTGKEDCKIALTTLFNVIFNIVNMMAPFAPFLSETMYQQIKIVANCASDSVHYLMLPTPDSKLINLDIERAVSRMQSVIELGRVLRDRKTLPIKYPVPEIVIVHQDGQYLTDILSLQEYIQSELNVRKISTTSDKSKFGITLRAEPDYKTLGLRLKNEFKTVTAAIKALSDKEINEIAKIGHGVIAGHNIDISELKLIFKVENLNLSQYEVNSDNDVVILLDTTPDSSMQDEGTAREIINRIQKLRKKAHLVPADEISVFCRTEKEIERVAKEFLEFIEGTIKAPFKINLERSPGDSLLIEETQNVKDCNLYLALTKKSDFEEPTAKWVNLQLVDFKPRLYNSDKAMVLLEAAGKKLSLKQLHEQIISLFGVTSFSLWGKNGEVINDKILHEAARSTLTITKLNKKPVLVESAVPFCKIHNFSRNGKSSTLILENPVGNTVLDQSDFDSVIKCWVN
ncbi:hypothetical protein HHI36_019265 [Cryptolaemus montrouzieri]|uniref:isoleucine--tRNA ligase n=1 Tax=Cryptolaemus montrouzieri TaxID=559131 RepID=A0ABD2P359_9CUCU